MNAITGMTHASVLDADIEVLLEPVAGDAPAGASLRYDPVCQAIRQAREQDDETLPMGDWERPLVKADWKRVASLCGDALRERSKDLQLAAWLCEAWTHLSGVNGLIAGTQLLIALVERYWDSVHPQIDDDGDNGARAATFEWINDTFASLLTLHVPLLTVNAGEPVAVNLERWERTMYAPPDDENGSETSLWREVIEEEAARQPVRDALAQLAARLHAFRDLWTQLDALVDERLADEAPSLARVADASARLLRAATALAGRQGAQPFVKTASAAATGSDDTDPVPYLPQTALATAFPTEVVQAPMPAVAAGGVIDRDHAYEMLATIADYLAQHEPHSPTPYLIRRAVSWGRMSLPELMREVAQEEGGLGRYLSMLGLH